MFFKLWDDNFLNSVNANGGPISDSVASSRLVRLVDYQLLFLTRLYSRMRDGPSWAAFYERPPLLSAFINGHSWPHF